MQKNKSLHLVFIKGHNKLAGVFKFLGNSEYNHMAVSLTDDLSELYSFSRYYKNNPIYSGFTAESPLRYLSQGKDTELTVVSIPISDATHDYLQRKFTFMLQHQFRYRYSFKQLFSFALRRQSYVPDENKICLSFATSTLDDIGIETMNVMRFEELINQLTNYKISKAYYRLRDRGKYSWKNDHYLQRTFKPSLRAHN